MLNNSYHILLIHLILTLLVTGISSRAVNYDRSDEEVNNNDLIIDESAGETQQRTLSFNPSIRSAGSEDDNSRFVNELYGSNNDADVDVDSYEERQFHERSLFTTLRPPQFVSARTREELIDLLQKAVNQGWRPSLKHYNHSNRFGRHRR